MPTKPVDRLMFAQGNCCFFCSQPLPKDQATVEHLVALANGGPNSDHNCVACCRTMNQLLGSRSLKEKFQVILNQKGNFLCPNGVGSTPPAVVPATTPNVESPPQPAVRQKAAAAPKPVARPAKAAASAPAVKSSGFGLVVAYLKQYERTRPRTLKALSNVVTMMVKGTAQPNAELTVNRLLTDGYVLLDGDKVTYPKWEPTLQSAT